MRRDTELKLRNAGRNGGTVLSVAEAEEVLAVIDQCQKAEPAVKQIVVRATKHLRSPSETKRANP